MDGQPLHGLSGIQTSSWRFRRIQQQIYVWPDDFARRVLHHTSGPFARDLSQLLFSINAVAVFRNTFGKLKDIS
jgi:hypothetical protein